MYNDSRCECFILTTINMEKIYSFLLDNHYSTKLKLKFDDMTVGHFKTISSPFPSTQAIFPQIVTQTRKDGDIPYMYYKHMSG